MLHARARVPFRHGSPTSSPCRMRPTTSSMTYQRNTIPGDTPPSWGRSHTSVQTPTTEIASPVHLRVSTCAFTTHATSGMDPEQPNTGRITLLSLYIRGESSALENHREIPARLSQSHSAPARAALPSLSAKLQAHNLSKWVRVYPPDVFQLPLAHSQIPSSRPRGPLHSPPKRLPAPATLPRCGAQLSCTSI